MADLLKSVRTFAGLAVVAVAFGIVGCGETPPAKPPVPPPTTPPAATTTTPPKDGKAMDQADPEEGGSVTKPK